MSGEKVPEGIGRTGTWSSLACTGACASVHRAGDPMNPAALCGISDTVRISACRPGGEG